MRLGLKNFNKINKKLTLFFVLLVFFVLGLSGCGSSIEDLQTINFGNYTVKIGDKFENTDLSMFKNKRTEESIFKAFVYPYNGEEIGGVFEKNIIFGVIENKRKIDTKTFAGIAKTSIMETFPGYSQVSFFDKKIKCKELEDINLYIHSFGYTQYDNLSGGYYTTQAYFANKKMMYTLSASSDIKQDCDIFEEYFKTLKCRELEDFGTGEKS